MKRVLLTGASGFVGSHVLRHLFVNTDWQIVCLSSFRHRGITDRIRYAMDGIEDADRRAKVLIHDLAAPISSVLSNEIGKIDYVFNVASDSHVDRSIIEPTPFIENNVSLICNMLDWARNSEIEKFIQVSTDEVYGPAPIGHEHKEWEPYFPSNPYSASKAAQESIAFSYWRTYGVPLIITNTMNIIGEMQDPEKYVPMIMKRLLNNELVTIHASPDGDVGSRYYLHARNQADALLFVANNVDVIQYGESDRPEKLNIVGEREVDNYEIAYLVAQYMKVPLMYTYVDFHSSRPGHDLRYALDGGKMAEKGWKAPLSLEQSLERTVRWTLNHKEWLSL